MTSFPAVEYADYTPMVLGLVVRESPSFPSPCQGHRGIFPLLFCPCYLLLLGFENHRALMRRNGTEVGGWLESEVQLLAGVPAVEPVAGDPDFCGLTGCHLLSSVTSTVMPRAGLFDDYWSPLLGVQNSSEKSLLYWVW